jgi:RNA polymerase sigma factor (sigma-70 family)
VDEVHDLVVRAASGDPEAWSSLVERFADMVWGVARSVGLRPSDAADVSQTTWLRLCEHLGHLRDPSRVGPWLAITARREAVRVSKLGARQVVADPWTWLEQADADLDEPGSLLADRERATTVQCALAVMPERCRGLLAAVSKDPPVAYEVLAARLGIAVGSVGPTRRRCLEQLRRVIEQISPELSEDTTSAPVGL